MKIAYLMLVHKNPRLLKRAIEALSDGVSGFFIHVDRKSDMEDFSDIRGDHVFFSNWRDPVYWGEFSQVAALLGLIRQALCSSENYGYFVSWHGSDYPLRNGRYVQAFLQEHNGSEFINLVRMPAPGYPLSKINKLRYPSDKPLRRFASRALAKFGLAYRDYRKYLRGLEAYAGHACFALTRSACQYIADFAVSNVHVEEYFRKTFTSDEMYFQTILGNSPFRSQVRRNLVYMDWSRSLGHHPAMLDADHLKLFEAQEKVWVEDVSCGSGEALFARKFSDDRLDLVDRMDEMIRRKGECAGRERGG